MGLKKDCQHLKEAKSAFADFRVRRTDYSKVEFCSCLEEFNTSVKFPPTFVYCVDCFYIGCKDEHFPQHYNEKAKLTGHYNKHCIGIITQENQIFLHCAKCIDSLNVNVNNETKESLNRIKKFLTRESKNIQVSIKLKVEKKRKAENLKKKNEPPSPTDSQRSTVSQSSKSTEFTINVYRKDETTVNMVRKLDKIIDNSLNNFKVDQNFISKMKMLIFAIESLTTQKNIDDQYRALKISHYHGRDKVEDELFKAIRKIYKKLQSTNSIRESITNYSEDQTINGRNSEKHRSQDDSDRFSVVSNDIPKVREMKSRKSNSQVRKSIDISSYDDIYRETSKYEDKDLSKNIRTETSSSNSKKNSVNSASNLLPSIENLSADTTSFPPFSGSRLNLSELSDDYSTVITNSVYGKDNNDRVSVQKNKLLFSEIKYCANEHHVGLINLKLNCHVNTIFQLFLRWNNLSSKLLKFLVIDSLTFKFPPNNLIQLMLNNEKLKMMQVLYNFFNEYRKLARSKSENLILNPEQTIIKMSKLIGKDLFEQQDSGEILENILDILAEESLASVNDALTIYEKDQILEDKERKAILKKVEKMTTRYILRNNVNFLLKCQKCGQEENSLYSRIINQFLNCPLDSIYEGDEEEPPSFSIHSSFVNYLSKQDFSNIKCAGCGCSDFQTLSYHFSKTPSILFLSSPNKKLFNSIDNMERIPNDEPVEKNKIVNNKDLEKAQYKYHFDFANVFIKTAMKAVQSYDIKYVICYKPGDMPHYYSYLIDTNSDTVIKYDDTVVKKDLIDAAVENISAEGLVFVYMKINKDG